MKYSPETLKYYNNLKNIGEFTDMDIDVGIGIVGSPLCGDVMKLHLLFNEDNDIIIDAKYKVFGCVSAIASMEYVCDLLRGRSIEEALNIENEDVADTLDLTDIKRHCSVLAKEAIVSAIDNYRSKKNKGENCGCMITVSPSALKKIKELVFASKKEYIGVEVIAEQGGCSGIVYSLQYAKNNDDDTVVKKVTSIEGVDFYYLEEDELLINGIFIDLVENSFGEGFVITNKNHMTCENCNCKCDY
ncbi:MAG: iron-sulfur cluster assembly scaffold protein [Holosporales bacterium]|jgi:nitrogen fixation NifU-like protein|nr:iron-sulfur cluster assembly scaffold protein [Holosporales bacterium]